MARNICLIFTFFSLIATSPATASTESPWRLQRAIGTPDWLTVSGEHRQRLELVNGQFRPGRTGNDQALMMRTLIHAVAGRGPFKVGLELGDSRVYFNSSDTPIGGADVNTADIVQAYLSAETDSLFGTDTKAILKLGRQTLNLGSGRQVFRPGYRNVVRPLTGAYLRLDTANGDELHAFYSVPVSTLPNDRNAILDNGHAFDKELWQQRFFGLHYRRANFLGGIAPDLWGEAYLYGFRQDDSESAQTPDRRVTDIGGRLFRAPASGEWDMDVEASWRFGDQLASALPGETESLDVSANMLFAAAGYTFETAAAPRLALEYFVTGGDDDPADATYGRYERYFSDRRRDLGNTGIFGPLNAVNQEHIRLNSRMNLSTDTSLQATYAAAYLASGTDTWDSTGLRDASGDSGDFVGHLIEGTLRHWLIPGSLHLEAGGSLFVFGGFTKNVPGGPDGTRALYGFGQLTFHF